MRKKPFYTFLLGAISLILSSCGKSYTIKGQTDGLMADGQKYFLTTFTNNELKDIDSCDVVHGQFEFHGSTDSVKLGLIISDEFILPVILEGGEINVKLDSKTGTEVTGGEYNDKFSEFRKELEKLDGEVNDLSNKQMDGIKNGENEDSLNTVLTQQARVILERKEAHIKKFIVDNMENPLATATFQGLTIVPFMMQNGYAELSPWIDEILTKANDTFKNDPYVKFYINRAKEVEGILNGTIEVPGQQSPQPAEQPQQQPGIQQQPSAEQAPTEDDAERLKELEGTIPTPNQLAEPSNGK